LSFQFFFSPSLYVLLQQRARPSIRRSGRSLSWPRLSLPSYHTLPFFPFPIRHPISPSSVPRWLPPEASPSHPTSFHFSRSILSYAAFMSRTPSMPAAMPNLAHTTQLRNKSAMHSHATMMGRRHNKMVDTIMPKIQD